MTLSPKRPKTGIVHLGLGAFFRAHGAVYIQDSMRTDGGDWGVVGVSLKSPGTRDKLRDRDWFYTAAELHGEGTTTQDIRVLNDVLVAPENPQAVLDAMTPEAVKIVSLTVTEKGYCLTSSDGGLNLDHPDIQHDLKHELPLSAPGYIVRALEIRRNRGRRPFTVMSLDNLPDNGSKIKAAVIELAQAIDPNLADWIKEEVRFPATMVDRIVPATTDALVEKVEQITGLRDLATVGHEPFRQWVIADDFVDGIRPKFENVGAQLVQNVDVFEHMKLRMLNGTHSSLAYLGALAGHRTVAAACADPVFETLLRHLWQNEIIPTLDPPSGTDLRAYSEALLARYQNPAIRHRLEQIAMDGSQKLPQRIISTVMDNIQSKRPTDGLILALAAWIRFLAGQDDANTALCVSDPLKEDLQNLIAKAPSREALVDALLNMNSIFVPEARSAIGPALLKALKALDNDGAVARIKGITS